MEIAEVCLCRVSKTFIKKGLDEFVETLYTITQEKIDSTSLPKTFKSFINQFGVERAKTAAFVAASEVATNLAENSAKSVMQSAGKAITKVAPNFASKASAGLSRVVPGFLKSRAIINGSAALALGAVDIYKSNDKARACARVLPSMGVALIPGLGIPLSIGLGMGASYLSEKIYMKLRKQEIDSLDLSALVPEELLNASEKCIKAMIEILDEASKKTSKENALLFAQTKRYLRKTLDRIKGLVKDLSKKMNFQGLEPSEITKKIDEQKHLIHNEYKKIWELFVTLSVNISNIMAIPSGKETASGTPSCQSLEKLPDLFKKLTDIIGGDLTECVSNVLAYQPNMTEATPSS